MARLQVRRYMVARFEVTGLSEAEEEALAFEVSVQSESSDGRHPGVPAPGITYVTERRFVEPAEEVAS